MANTDDDVKRVAIIGAGLSGLLSLYHLKSSRTKIELTAFEKNFDIGGTWLYTDQTKPNDFGLPVYTGLYKYLRFVGILWCFYASFIFLILDKLDISIMLVLLIEGCNISNIFLTSQFRESSSRDMFIYLYEADIVQKKHKVLLSLIQNTNTKSFIFSRAYKNNKRLQALMRFLPTLHVDIQYTFFLYMSIHIYKYITY